MMAYSWFSLPVGNHLKCLSISLPLFISKLMDICVPYSRLFEFFTVIQVILLAWYLLFRIFFNLFLLCRKSGASACLYHHGSNKQIPKLKNIVVVYQFSIIWTWSDIILSGRYDKIQTLTIFLALFLMSYAYADKVVEFPIDTYF